VLARLCDTPQTVPTRPRRKRACQALSFEPPYTRSVSPGDWRGVQLEKGRRAADLVIGYSWSNTSPALKLFLSRPDQLMVQATSQLH
jgi:hypothetical protein